MHIAAIAHLLLPHINSRALNTQHKPLIIQHSAACQDCPTFHATVLPLQLHCTLQLLPGDVLYLVREGTAQTAGFRLALASSSSNSGTSHTPPPKRKSDATAPSSASKRCKLNAKPTAATAPAAAAAAAAPTDSLGVTLRNQCATGSGGLAEQLQSFAGVRLCVWDPHHTQRAAHLAAKAGAELQQAVTASTTHVIAP